MAAKGGHGRDTRGEHDAHGYESLYREVELGYRAKNFPRGSRVPDFRMGDPVHPRASSISSEEDSFGGLTSRARIHRGSREPPPAKLANTETSARRSFALELQADPERGPDRLVVDAVVQKYNNL